MISWNEKTPFSAIKTKSPRSRKIDIFPKGLSQVLLQKWPFFQLFCLGNISQENVFYDILERKNAFLCYKRRSRKIYIFPKGLTHGFGPKMVIFPSFFLGNIGQENVFYAILERKKAFLGYKNKEFKKSKNWLFSKRVNQWFWSKNGHFSNFFY